LTLIKDEVPRFSTPELMLLAVAVTGVIGTVLAFVIGYRKIREIHASQKGADTAEPHSLAVASELQDLRFSVQGLNSRIDKLEAGVETALEASKTTVKHTIAVRELAANINRSYKNLQEQVRLIDERYRGMLPETEAKAVTPTALINLTSTELIILKILAQSGPKQTSELHTALRKSREHTARLMKKLFKAGYVERETQAIPFTYRINEKIKKAIEETAIAKEESESLPPTA